MPASSNAAIIPLAPRRTPLADHLEAFLTKLTVDSRSKHTISAYRRDLVRVFDTLESLRPALNIADVTPGLLDQALAAPAIVNTARGQRSAASLHRLKAAVKAFFAWARDTGLVAEDPARGVRLKRLPRKPPSFLTQAEKRKLLKELKGRNTPADRRDRVIFELLLGTGIRLGELVGLDLDDVDLDAKHLRVRAKGNICQVKFLKTDLRSLLRAWLNERRRMAPDGERALFLSNRGTRITPRQVARRLDGWLARAGIGKRLSPHGLRHTFATHLYDATSDLLVVQRALGHRDIATTEIYTHLVDGRLEEALERL
jgi:integrase/recombinase XerC